MFQAVYMTIKNHTDYQIITVMTKINKHIIFFDMLTIFIHGTIKHIAIKTFIIAYPKEQNEF